MTARVNLAQNLAKLPCLLTQCDGADCQSRRSSNVLFAQIYQPIIASLLDGTNDEVTPTVRRQSFQALRRALDHHAVTISLDGLDDAGKLLLQYVKDPDRSARLSAW
jgi:serine/threonine-protein kinase ATR